MAHLFSPVTGDETGRIICRPGRVYRLPAGHAALCADDPHHAGSLRRLAEMKDGDAVFALPAGAGPRLVIVPDDGSVHEAMAGGLPPADLAASADAWARLAGRLLHHLPDRPDENGEETAGGMAARLAEAGEYRLEAGERVAPTGEAVLWCQVRAGTAGEPWLGHSVGAGAPPFPLLRDAPVGTPAGATLHLAATEELARGGLLATALEDFTATLAAGLASWQRRQAHAFARRVAAAADADAAVLSGALHRLGGTGPAMAAPNGFAEPPLVAMLRLAAEAAGARLDGELAPPLTAGDPDEYIKVLAEGAGLRARRIRLAPQWWRASGEAMLGFLQDGTPVAIIADGRQWRIHHPDGSTRPVTAAAAAALAEPAYVLYRGFGDMVARPGRALIAFTASLARRELVLIAITSLFASLLGLATPFLSGFLIQSVIPDGVQSEVVQLIGAVLAVSCGIIGFELARGLTVLRAESLLGSAVEGALWNRLLRLPASFFRRFGAGDLALRTDAVNQMRRTVGFATLTALVSALFSLINLVVLFSYGMAPALLALGVCAVEIVLLTGHALFNTAMQRKALDNAGRMQTLTVQIFQGLSKLRVAAAESRLLARWIRLFAVDQSLHYRVNVVGSGVTAFGAGWNILIMAALIGLVGFGLSPMKLGDYVTYSGVFGQFVAATLSLAGLIPALAAVAPLWDRVRPILSEPEENSGRGLHPGRISGEIEVVRASFGYPGGEPALHDISLRVPAGAFVAVVGPSGSGKSTLLRLLIGFETPDSGQVLVDGRNLADLDAGAVRRQLGVVLQHSRLEAGSIYQNIAGAAPLSAEEAWAAADCAGLGPDLAAMPMGIHTYVDDNGTTLSGGQRQRLLLARAIARRPRIMLLDEATSALDNLVQARVMNVLAQMNATRIVVAHRLTTVRDADLIVVMDAGRVVETGTYDSLAAAGGLFSDLIRRQLS